MLLCLGLTPALQRTMLFNEFALSAVNRAVETHESAAGKSVNVARVIRAMGGEPLAMGLMGGERGQLLLSHLDAAKVSHDFVSVAPQTRLCTTIVTRADRQVTELVEESAAVAAAALDEVIQRLGLQLGRARLLILSGSLTPGAPNDFYRTCAELARQRNVPVLVDAQGQPLLEALAGRPVLVKPNRSELGATFGSSVRDEADLRAGMSRLIEMGACNVVVTMGADGAAATNGQGFWRIHVPRVDAVNPIGSGDAFTAGLGLALSKGQALDEACRLGAACATANALTLIAGTVRPSDVTRLLPEIRVERF